MYVRIYTCIHVYFYKYMHRYTYIYSVQPKKTNGRYWNISLVSVLHNAMAQHSVANTTFTQLVPSHTCTIHKLRQLYKMGRGCITTGWCKAYYRKYPLCKLPLQITFTSICYNELYFLIVVIKRLSKNDV